MAIIVQSTDSINAPTGVVMSGAGDQYWLLAGVNLVSSSFIGLHMTGGSAVVTVDGTVQSALAAVQVSGANSFISVGATGVVRATGQGFYMLGVSSRLENGGLINSLHSSAVYCAVSGISVINTGQISSGDTGVYLGGNVSSPEAASFLENHGTIVGGYRNTGSYNSSAGVYITALAAVVNYGTISSAATASYGPGYGAGIGIGVSFGGGSNGFTTITNHGTVSSARNWGISAVYATSDDGTGITIVNTGLISGNLGSIYASGFGDTVKNSGTLMGNVLLRDALDRMENTGRVVGDVNLGSGNDEYIGRFGSVSGVVYGEANDDVMIGGTLSDHFSGGTENDVLRGLEGDDTLYGDDGFDRIDGGQGDDSIFGGWDGDVLQGGVGEDTVAGDEFEDLIYGNSDADQLFGGTSADTLFGGSGDDDLDGGMQDDLLSGGRGDDSLNGWTENDVLDGDAGADTLLGFNGNDNLSGGAGADVLFGGKGRDTLAGGADADIFVFVAATDCGLGNNRDTLTDFASGQDKVDLAAIKAGMSFISGSAFGNVAGQVRYDVGTGLLSGDTNGDSVADFNLQFAAGTVLVAGDFIF